jgi:hypothetical protein
VATHRPYPEDGGRPYVPVDPYDYTLRVAEGPPCRAGKAEHVRSFTIATSSFPVTCCLVRRQQCTAVAVFVFLIHAVAFKKKVGCGEVDVLRDVTPYSLVEILRRFGLTHCTLF